MTLSNSPHFPDVAVVGMHFRGDEAKALVASFVPPLELQLEREPSNQYDANAVKVLYHDTHIGYIERGQAAFIAAYMDDGWVPTCTVTRLEQRRNNLHPICDIA